jgi:hypothetical protein
MITAILPRAKSGHVAASCLVKTAHPLLADVLAVLRGAASLYFNEVLIAENLVFNGTDAVRRR